VNFCSHCGSALDLLIPEGDNLPRHVCAACGAIHYLNPKLVVGCIVESRDTILLCRRSIAPRAGYWTLPAGFMENGESTADAARRETIEEACARVDIGQPFAMVSIPHINQVHLFYRARLLDGHCAAGLETLEVKFFAEGDIPWADIAFLSVTRCLEAYFADRKNGSFRFHDDEIRRPPSRPSPPSPA